MSRIHCVVECTENAVRVVDNESKGGTYVGEDRVDARELRPGDVIRIGESRIRFSMAGPSEMSTIGGGSSAARRSIPKLQDLLGETLSDYRLDEIITMGNSGMVFRGIDVANDRAVAVKVLTPDLASSDEQKERFVRAMQTMLPIDHPNIVKLYGAG